MLEFSKSQKTDYFLVGSVIFLVVFSVLILYSIAPFLFPAYFLYILLGFVAFFVLSRVNFEVVSLFSWHSYIGSIFLLLITLFIGQITRGVVRWIPIGSFTIQPAEIIRPFLIVFFAKYLTEKPITLSRLISAGLLFTLPFFLIVVQPSLGVAVLTAVAFLGVILSSSLEKKYFVYAGLGLLVIIPLVWFLLIPYQRERIITFLNPYKDPYKSGYNSIQSVISVGSGKIVGRGLGKGVQGQLAFLPERYTDFIFAASAEELGLLGSVFILLGEFLILARLTSIMENSQSFASRAYVSGFFLTYLAQTLIHVGMNIGLLPITGVPLPLFSAGGSSFLGMMTGLGIAVGARKQTHSLAS